MAGRMGARLMAIVADGDHGRVYLSPTDGHERIAASAEPGLDAAVAISGSTQYLGVKPYGMERFDQLFAPRQLSAMNVFCDLIGETAERITHDAIDLPQDDQPLDSGGCGGKAYGEAVLVYLAFALSKLADLGNSLCRWEPIAQCPRQLFGRQAIPIVWDYAEGNPLGESSGSWTVFVDGIVRAFTRAFGSVERSRSGRARQEDAGTQTISNGKVVSTDPPYYDNIPYSDISDFFYVWLRRSLRDMFPDIFATLTAPKLEEIVAFSYRHDSKDDAERFFLDRMQEAMIKLVEQAHNALPVTIYYAFKQSETRDDSGGSNTGWETFLESVIKAGFSITGTWPMRTENRSRMRGMESNALASSIVLVCRRRPADAPRAPRRIFRDALEAELPAALIHLQRANIAPVDLAQAAIGPGMAIFTRYAAVLDPNTGRRITVREALSFINKALDEILTAQEGEFDTDSRWALAWFDQHGFEAGEYGSAETLATAKNTSVNGMVRAGIIHAQAGRVRLLRPRELPADWDPAADDRLTTWEVVHHMIRALEQLGEVKTAALLRRLGGAAEGARELCYRLYTICERKQRAAEALDYNGLVQAWPELRTLSLSDELMSQTEMPLNDDS